MPSTLACCGLVKAAGGVFNPSGEDIPPGFETINWSPITDAKTWEGALRTADRMVLIAGRTRTGNERTANENSNFWQKNAGKLLAGLLFYAALTDRDMQWLYRTVSAARFTGKTEKDRNEMQPILHYFEQNHLEDALREFEGRFHNEYKRVADTFATLGVTLEAYAYPAAQRSAAKPHLDSREFVKGRPEEPTDLRTDDGFSMIGGPRLVGQYDTIYIIGSSVDQQRLTPLIITFLMSIRDAAYTQARQDLYANLRDRQPTLFVLDELYNMAAFPDLIGMLSEGASQGLLIAGALQSRKQAVERWGPAGDSLIGLWQNLIVFPGLGDREFYHDAAELIGKYEHIKGTASQSRNKYGGIEWLQSYTTEERYKVTIDQLAQGHPSDPHAAMVFRPGGKWGWVRMMAYYRSMPWPLVMAAGVEWALMNPRIAEFPLPLLNFDGTYRWLHHCGGAPLVDYWRTQERHHAEGGYNPITG